MVYVRQEFRLGLSGFFNPCFLMMAILHLSVICFSFVERDADSVI